MQKNLSIIIILLCFYIPEITYPNSNISYFKHNYSLKRALSIDMPDDSIIPCNQQEKNHLLGKFNPAKDTAFILADQRYSYPNIWIRKPVLTAFLKMAEDAEKEGIKLFIVSGTRTYSRQKTIWEQKWSGNKLVEGMNLAKIKDTVERAKLVLTYTAMPGTSRHHWGTDIDINSMEPAYFKTPKGKKILEWLELNAHKYGFYRPYTAKNADRTSGYEEEFWHWSYMPLASKFMTSCLNCITYDDITGFKGAGTSRQIEIFDNYIKAIDKNCLNYQ